MPVHRTQRKESIKLSRFYIIVYNDDDDNIGNNNDNRTDDEVDFAIGDVFFSQVDLLHMRMGV